MLQAYVKASNSEEQDFFGSTLALSADGSALAVGARDEDSAAKGIDPDEGGAFGASVALSPTGSVLIAGAPAEHTTAGRVYVYPLP